MNVSTSTFVRSILVFGSLVSSAQSASLSQDKEELGLGNKSSFQGPLLTASESRLLMNGLPCRLIGYSDLGLLAERSFDYKGFFKILEKHRVNLVRVWVCYQWAQDLMPFEVEGGGYSLLRISQASVPSGLMASVFTS